VTKLLYSITDSITELLNVSSVSTIPVQTIPPSEPAASELEKPNQVKLEDVRAVLAELSTNGQSGEVRKLLAKYGVTRLSEVKPEDYAALKADAEAIPNG
jgi:hypothetical protein